MKGLGDQLGFRVDVPWRALPERAREALLHGENYQVHVRYRNRFGRERSYTSGFEGVVPFIKRRHAETESDWSPRAVRGVHARGALPGVRGCPAQARGARRADR